MPETPFDSLESAQRYIALLRESVEEAQGSVREDIARADPGQHRPVEALRLVDHKLTQLGGQLRSASRLLNDLRMLRRVLIGDASED
jgi:hypothetical protein